MILPGSGKLDVEKLDRWCKMLGDNKEIKEICVTDSLPDLHIHTFRRLISISIFAYPSLVGESTFIEIIHR